MTIKEKLVAHRIDIAFIMFVIILVSFAPTIFLDDDRWTIIPLFLLSLLIIWLVYSSIAKNKLVREGTISDVNTDFINNFMWDFKPNSQVKFILAAYGMTIGLMILITAIPLIILPESVVVDKAFSPFGFPFGFVLFCGLFIASYFFVKKRLK